MSVIVQKFGGTSVADSEKILAAARKAVRAQQQGNQVLMVVSAMGKNTDMLVKLAGEITDKPAAREMDMLLSTGEQVSVALMAMAIHSLGYKAVSLTGAQIGIKTDSTHTKARISSISTDRLKRLLDDGNIVIAAGFQGIDDDYNITTLGRGGSDTTAVALAAALDADLCEIFTDVDGVYTTDPRELPAARRMDQISYNEMLEMASLGAGVMHNRAIEFAKKFGVSVHVRSSFTDVEGTIISEEPEQPIRAVCGAAVTRDVARITVRGVPDVPGTSYEILSRIAERAVAVDMIVQDVSDDGRTDISFTVPSSDLAQTIEAVEESVDVLDAEGHVIHKNVAKVSVIGLGMATQTGVANIAFKALADAGVNIQIITTSEIKISMLVEEAEVLEALRALHRAFELEKHPSETVDASSAPALAPKKTTEKITVAEAADLLKQSGMEELVIDSIGIDTDQARVTLRNVPDSPGFASRVFDEIAAGGVFVDMIVQSIGHDGCANISCTVKPEQVDQCVAIARQLVATFKGGEVTSSPQVAKLEVSGIGLRSHTGVATRMSRSLSAAGINLELINTSEVLVNVIVGVDRGEQAIACLKEAFADVL